MCEDKMKPITLLIMSIFLCACAAQETSQGIPEFNTESQEQCATNCELIHAGSIRACSQGQIGADSTGSTVTRCVEDTYETLRSCYRSCK